MTTLETAPGAPSGDGDDHLLDHEARAAISSDLANTVFAVAGAGSGKTRHLVDRVVGIVVEGAATIDQLAAITFTEAAAAELRDRIAEGLEAVAIGTGGAGAGGAGTGGEGAGAATEPGLQAQRAADALAGLDGAAITTLHGFARRVLAAHPFEAGIPPAFEVLDEVQSMADLDGRWSDVVDGLLADRPSARALQWVLACGARLDALRQVVRQLGADWDLLPTPPAPRALPVLDGASVLDPLRAALSLAPACTSETDRLADHLAALVPVARRIENALGDDLELLRVLGSLAPTLRTTRGQGANWGGRKPEVHALLDQAHAARQRLVSSAIDAALQVVVAALSESILSAARQRRREGRLEFHDLLVLARDLVRGRADVRAALHEQYRFVLVDEFQDTDPIQAELVVLIAAEPAAAVQGEPWHDVPTVPGALFFVGDPHQSIYRFRRADLETFWRTRRQVATKVAPLVTNFRSLPGIVGWVDEVFSALIGGAAGNEDDDHRTVAGAVAAPAYARAVAARADPASGGGTDAGHPRSAVTVLGVGAEPPEHAYEARRREADEVVGTLCADITAGRSVGDDAHPMRPSDVTVLIPTRTALPSLQSAMDAAGLPYRLQSSSLVYAAAEVRDLLHVLQAVDDPADALSVVAALRSPAFGCGDDDLWAFRSAGGSWDYRRSESGPASEGDPVPRALAALRALHEARAWCEVSELVERVVDQRRFMASALDGPRWREEWRRLRFVADQARQFCESSSGGLRQYLAWVALQRADDARVTEVVLPETDVDAVSVMTIHAAKGLEFPVVAVVGLGARPRGVRAPKVLFGPGGPEVAIGAGLCTEGYEALRAREAQLDVDERVRLLYVAVTRARDHLVVSVHRSARAEASLAARLELALPDPSCGLWDAPDLIGRVGALGPCALGQVVDAGGPAQVVAEPPGAPRTDAAGGPAGRTDEDPLTSADLARWMDERARLFARSPSVVAATAVAKLAASAAARAQPSANPPDGLELSEPYPSSAEEPDGASDPRRLGRRGRAGTALGRAVHAVLQTVDLAGGEGLEGLARAHAEAEGIPERASTVASLCRSALASEVVKTAAAGRHWRELYVGVPAGSRVLEGFVDLLFEGPEGLEIVDYKTDRLASEADADELERRYRLQGAAYARAVSRTVGRPVQRCSFLFLGPTGGVVRSVRDLEQAMEEVDATLGALI